MPDNKIAANISLVILTVKEPILKAASVKAMDVTPQRKAVISAANSPRYGILSIGSNNFY